MIILVLDCTSSKALMRRLEDGDSLILDPSALWRSLLLQTNTQVTLVYECKIWESDFKDTLGYMLYRLLILSLCSEKKTTRPIVNLRTIAIYVTHTFLSNQEIKRLHNMHCGEKCQNVNFFGFMDVSYSYNS